MSRLLLLSFCAWFLSGLQPVSGQDRRQLRIEALDPQTRLPQGWSTGIGKGESGTGGRLRADSLIRHEGRYSLSLESDGSAPVASAVHVIRKSAQADTVRLRGYMRTKDVSGWAGLWMRIDGRDGMLAFDNMQYRKVIGSTDWTEYEITLPYERTQAERICVGALVVGSGKVWIDDLQVTLDNRDIAAVPDYSRPMLPAERDTSNFGGSGIRKIVLSPEKIRRLADVCEIWGFLKYYHAGVQLGNHNMDAALFRFLPMVLAAKDSVQCMEFMERWVDMFGKPDPCVGCRKTASGTEDIALLPDYGRIFQPGHLPPSLLGKLAYIRDNRYISELKHYYIDLYPGIGNPRFTHEYGYGSQPYPDAGTRLLALFRYWNMIRYFFPYRHLTGEDWNGVLTDAIPEFCNAADVTAYQLACLRLIARVHDTHANIWNNPAALAEVKGRLILPVYARFIEDQLVVTGYYKDTPGVRDAVRPGDVIERIDDVPVRELVKRYLSLTPASNYETQLRDLAGGNGFLMRGNRDTVLLRVSRGGKSRELSLRRVPFIGARYMQGDTLFVPDRGYKLLPGNIGYIYPARLTNSSIDSIRPLFKGTAGLIIDLRCYPGTFMPFTYGAWLKPRESAFARFTVGSTNLPGLFTRTPTVANGGGDSDTYRGKVVLIVDARTQSQAEYTAMALQTVPGTRTIGSTTAAADGNVSDIALPGGLSTMISGIGVLYPDGTETQRKGVMIDQVIRPGISDIREGRDELLEAALRMLR